MRRLGRILILIIIDAVLINLSLYAALWLRFDGDIPFRYISSLERFAVSFTLLMLLFFFLFGLYNRLWQYASIGELFSILGAVTAGIVGFFFYSYVALQTLVFPRSVFIFTWLLMIFLIGTSRLSWRFMRDHWFFPEKVQGYNPVLVVGAGDAGAAVARELKNSKTGQKSVPIGFIDDDPGKQKLKMFGKPVLGKRQDIPRLVKKYDVKEIIIAIPSAPGWKIREIVDICYTTPAKLKILPGISDLINEKVSVNQIRELQVEDLLDRKPVSVDLESIAGYLKARTVLVTGAGGSIGSELCRQIARFKPRALILLDHGENSIYEIEMEIASLKMDVEIVPVVADTRDAFSIKDIFQRYAPQVVFHAAAYKHVPLMEFNPCEALKNNVFGTFNTAHCAHVYGAEAFVLVSTDKAVNPSSIMGASKRVSEMVIQQFTGSGTRFASVRFGNVLDSRGSVVPLFKKQIVQGGPVTVTHPDMTRYFMTIPESVQLVIQAGALARGGETFVLDMGKPVKIVDLAKRMIRLAGFRPEEDIKIIYSGVRPGEKLFEELLTPDEGLSSTCHQRIHIASPEQADQRKLEKLISMLSQEDWITAKEEVFCKLKEIIPGFKPCEITEASEKVQALIKADLRLVQSAKAKPGEGFTDTR